ncbi:MAG TPA: hypothetical protein VMX97_07750 [Hyphomicrobiaceae bacterium]|nr:hypothetical protein [Hyphomicrobiaceae bacterium]
MSEQTKQSNAGRHAALFGFHVITANPALSVQLCHSIGLGSKPDKPECWLECRTEYWSNRTQHYSVSLIPGQAAWMVDYSLNNTRNPANDNRLVVDTGLDQFVFAGLPHDRN